jgi:hypothetical protein
MNKKTISDIDLIKYIKKTNNEKLIKATQQIISLYPKMLLKTYLFNLLQNYDKTCENFSQFYEKLFIDIGLYNFHKYSFGLFI